MGMPMSNNTKITKPISLANTSAYSMLYEEGPPNPSLGLVGISLAHDSLVEMGRVGLLFGGIAKENFYGNNYLNNFNAHKDVDVMVLHRKDHEIGQLGYFDQFHNGIDWWEYRKTSRNNDSARYVNGNNVALRFSAILKKDHQPGLYIPGITILNSINEIEYQEEFTNTHPSMYFPFINIPRLLKRDVQIMPIQET